MTLYGLKWVRTGAGQDRKIKPQGFVAGYKMSASAQTVARISYVHAGIEVSHFAQLVEIHRILGMWENLVDFGLQMLITAWVE